MTRIEVEVQRDHLQRVVDRFSPIKAIAELIWNAVDSDATRVDVQTVWGPLKSVDAIRVADNGHGFSFDRARESFKDLGASWKRGRLSPKGRPLHGEKGEGRFSVLAIGQRAQWTTRWRDEDGTLREFLITSKVDWLGQFDLSSPRESGARTTGTEVEITNIDKVPKSLMGEEVLTKLAELFALYLLRHTEVRLFFDGERVDPAKVQSRVATYPVANVVDEEGVPISAEVTVIEWTHKAGRELVFCDDNGCALASRSVAFHTPGFSNFSVYLKSDYLRENQSVLDLDEMHTGLKSLVEGVKDIVKTHFRQRAAEEARGVVQRWKDDEIYPFEGLPTNPVEEAERQVFDVVALNITESLPDLESTGKQTKRLTFRILKTAIEQNPATVRRIIQEVLDLPLAKREELVELLEHTTLSSLIAANKVVVDRQRFLSGLEVVLYDFDSRKKTKERQHLHKLVEGEAWLFGEEYHLGVSDQGLEAVLKKHQRLLGRKPEKKTKPVLRQDGSQGIVDLMMSRQVPLPRGDEFEHLVVELKRPKKRIDSEVLQQIESYAFAVSSDERFRSSKVRWVFWVLSNEMDAFAEKKVHQAERPPGLLHRSENPSITIWAKTWNQVLDGARGRMRFYREALDLKVGQEDGIRHLQRVHSAHLPEVLQGTPNEKEPKKTRPADRLPRN